jgi:hypothetical protein
MVMIDEHEIIINAYFTNDTKTQVSVYINSEDGTRVENILVGTRKFNKLLEYVSLTDIHLNTTERLETATIRNKSIAKRFAEAEGYEKKTENPFLNFFAKMFNDDIEQPDLFKIKLDALLFVRDYTKDKKVRQKIKKSKTGREIIQIILEVTSPLP